MRFIGFVCCAMVLAGPAGAEPLLGLQRALDQAQAAADGQARQQERLHGDTQGALKRGLDAFTAAEQREQSAVIGALQATAALRRARQRLSEAVNEAVEQGEAIEHAAGRAARGELAPSATDLLACAGSDCAQIPAREHAALVMMGAVAPGFDKSAWPPEGAPAITVLPPIPVTPLSALRAEADATAARAHDTAVDAEQARAAMTGDTATRTAYAQALGVTDAARAEQTAAADRLAARLRGYADMGRAVKRAGLLAGDGYVLKRGGRKACAHDDCITTEGLEAAAFLVLGAAENMNDGLKILAPYLASGAEGSFVFR